MSDMNGTEGNERNLEKENQELRAKHDALDYRFACLAKKATHGRLSKTNYEMHVYYTEIEEVQQRLCEEYVKENAREIFKKLRNQLGAIT